jgi:putative transcriptional regulator
MVAITLFLKVEVDHLIADKHQQQFYQEVAQVLEQSRFDISTPLLGSGGCFDLVAKKQSVLLLIKLITNIDSFKEDQAYELRKLSYMLSGFPLIVGQNIRNSAEIEDGVVYTRYEIPAVSKNTLQNLLIKNLPPLIYAYRGGFKVRFDGALLKEKRLEKNFSLGDLAREIGVSKRAVYEYERGTVDVSHETAMRIEELLDEPLTIAINLFEEMKRIGSVTTPSTHSGAPKSDIEREVKKHFDDIGMKDQLWTKKIPIRVLAKTMEPIDEMDKFYTTITSISEQPSSDDVEKKIHITYSISKIAEADPLIVLGDDSKKSTIDDASVVSIDDLIKSKKKKPAEKK